MWNYKNLTTIWIGAIINLVVWNWSGCKSCMMATIEMVTTTTTSHQSVFSWLCVASCLQMNCSCSPSPPSTCWPPAPAHPIKGKVKLFLSFMQPTSLCSSCVSIKACQHQLVLLTMSCFKFWDSLLQPSYLPTTLVLPLPTYLSLNELTIFGGGRWRKLATKNIFFLHNFVLSCVLLLSVMMWGCYDDNWM